MAQSNPLPESHSHKPPVWRLHRFARSDAAVSAGRSLDEDIAAFFAALLRHFAGNGRWMAATASAKGGGIDVWFKFPAAPADAAFGAVWSRHLESFGLTSQAITSRN